MRADKSAPHLLTQSFRGEFQLRQGDWKYLNHMGSDGNNYTRGNLEKYALPETAPKATGQLFNLATDPGETTNLFFSEAEKRGELEGLLKTLTRKEGGRSAPRNRIWQTAHQRGHPLGRRAETVGQMTLSSDHSRSS